jgi:hypothetical protein
MAKLLSAAFLFLALAPTSAMEDFTLDMLDAAHRVARTINRKISRRGDGLPRLPDELNHPLGWTNDHHETREMGRIVVEHFNSRSAPSDAPLRIFSYMSGSLKAEARIVSMLLQAGYSVSEVVAHDRSYGSLLNRPDCQPPPDGCPTLGDVKLQWSYQVCECLEPGAPRWHGIRGNELALAADVASEVDESEVAPLRTAWHDYFSAAPFNHNVPLTFHTTIRSVAAAEGRPAQSRGFDLVMSVHPSGIRDDAEAEAFDRVLEAAKGRSGEVMVFAAITKCVEVCTANELLDLRRDEALKASPDRTMVFTGTCPFHVGTARQEQEVCTRRHPWLTAA